jgi:hypothetical protein
MGELVLRIASKHCPWHAPGLHEFENGWWHRQRLRVLHGRPQSLGSEISDIVVNTITSALVGIGIGVGMGIFNRSAQLLLPI